MRPGAAHTAAPKQPRQLTQCRRLASLSPRTRSARCAATAAPARAPSARASAPGSREAAPLLTLVQWAIANKIMFSGCRPELKDGARGVFTTTDVSPGETLVSVPLGSALTVRPGEPSPFPEFALWVGLPWYGQLATKLLHERALGPASRFADYLAVLPLEPVDLPALWPYDAVRALQYPYLEQQVVDEQQEWDRLYDRLSPHLARRRLCRADLLWALSCVRSRTFAGPHFPTPPAAKLAAGVAAAVAVAAAAAALGGGFAAVAQGGGGDAAVAVAVLQPLLAGLGVPAAWQAAEARRAQSGEAGTVLYAVCPFIDMFNHSSRAQSECVFSAWRSEFRVAAAEGQRRGQQVLLNYGGQSNDALLQRYGFVELYGNPHDRYVLEDVAALLERALEGAAGGVAAGSGGPSLERGT
ncbi:hypothetical protein TSOC_005889, partial [Tetrabaena socialis]